MLTEMQIRGALATLKEECDTNQQCIDDLRAEPVIDEEEEDDEIAERELIGERLWHAADALEAYKRVMDLLTRWDYEAPTRDELRAALDGGINVA